MKINEFRKISTIDYPRKLASVIFTPSCNFSCPACHARHVVYGESRYSEKDVFSYLDFAKGFVDAVVLCGGEPTLQPGLEDFCGRFKKRFQEKLLKLDTNGTNPSVLEDLLKENLIDYVALDVKGPKNLYPQITGQDYFDFREFEKSIVLTTRFPAYEFRTTIWPIAVDGEIRFMNLKEIEEMASWVSEYARKESKWYLQQFIARDKDEMIEERFSTENLSEEMRKTPQNLLEKIQQVMRKYFPNVKIRGES